MASRSDRLNGAYIPRFDQRLSYKVRELNKRRPPRFHVLEDRVYKYLDLHGNTVLPGKVIVALCRKSPQIHQDVISRAIADGFLVPL